MLEKYEHFLRGVSVNWQGKLGVILTTSSFVTFIIMQFAFFLGILRNAYIGLIIYLLFPSLFIIGLILVPIGWAEYRKTTGKTTRELLSERFEPDERTPRFWGSKVFQTIIILTSVNVVFMLAVSVQTLHFMDRPNFCGTACHSVMNPEWTTYQVSPHARVRCVDCHVGSGFGALVDSKLNGIWQMIALTFHLYPRPIPTPVHQLRPARETCEKCHWPEKFYGISLQTIIHYEQDSVSTPKYTTLGLKIDATKAGPRSGIHWHISEANEVRYTSIDDKREQIIWVEVKQRDGSYKRYTNTSLENFDSRDNNVRIMDCVDCHNRATHIYEYPGDAVDARISDSLMDRSIPYLAREALAAILIEYPFQQAAREGIAKYIHSYYENNYPEFFSSNKNKIDSMITVLQGVYARNIHPGMNIVWGSYPTNIGHERSPGCFRCHSQYLVDENGKSIPFDCTLCHSMLAYDSEKPFEFMSKPDFMKKDYEIHQYLGDEFLKSYP
jgi:hypothetical protein